MVQIEVLEQHGEFGFQTRIDDKDASIFNRPVYGLKATQGIGLTIGGAEESHKWETVLRPEANGWWVETTLTVKTRVDINPSMVLWLGTLDQMDDRQSHTWRQTILRGPTANQQGLGGNDLPACYLHDFERGIETICYYPADAFTWVPGRFHHFAAKEIFQYHPTARYGLGLLLNGPEETLPFEPGTYTLRWWFTQARRVGMATTWEAQRAMLDAITPLLDLMPRGEAISWPDLAERTLEDLYHEACWTTAEGVTGLRAYVLGSSAVARDEQRGFELMTQLDVLWPLLMWRDSTGSTKADEIIERLRATLPHFDRPANNYVANSFPPRRSDTRMDTWYFLENALIKLPWVAYLTGDETLKTMFRSAMVGAKTLAQNTGYVFPLFADAVDWQPRGSLLNVGVGGLYAAGCVLAAQLLGQPAYYTEAATALNIMYNLPPHMLTHEPQQLTFAAAAARMLAVNGYGAKWRTVAGDFVRLSLRMGYWADDPSVEYYDARGMFQACASLGYPAYKENVETLLAWPELLNDDVRQLPGELMAAFANLQRVHNMWFFDPYLPGRMRRGPCQHVPYEDLATAEFPHTAKLGKELYGAGEVFWSALLFNRYGTKHPDIMVMALDVPCLTLRRMKSRSPRLLLYNPTPSSRAVPLRSDGWERSANVPAKTATIIEGL